MGKITDMIQSPEQEQLINAVAELLIYICKDSAELSILEEQMKASSYKLLELHPEYCKKKAAIVEGFLQSIKKQGDSNNARH